MRVTAKLAIWLAVIFLLLFAIYQSYPIVLYQVMLWQKSFNQQISGSLTALSQHSQQAGLTLMLISFLYGVFHAVGPGHGKFILTSYLSLEKTKLTQAMKISLLSALMQGVVAVSLVTVIVVVFTLSRSYFNFTLKWVERGSFAFMILFGVYWCYQAFKPFWQKRKVQSTPKIRQISLNQNLQHNHKIQPLVTVKSHVHSEHCGCGHQHLPSSQQMQHAKDWKAQLMIIFSIGARPCSGAILVLFLAYTLDLYLWGIASALIMAVGTGLTLSLFAGLVLVARNKAIRLSSWYISEQTSKKLALSLKIVAGIGLILLGITLFHSSFIEISTGSGLLRR
ncbi:nickel/cobalt transporter [Actinobacillus vicugnae]|uniref:nickel/cobalt transporter n=1 Tax=Actinobacillus vicugnae TaxID=2573093 RepID=UPI001241F544|nr:nickel/cobalt transporter [Actinobacillus vicugnae]